MIALLQRVNHAAIVIDNETHAAIGKGILALIGLEAGDTAALGSKLLDRILAYRMFADDKGRMNRSLIDVGGELLLASQFTLVADTSSGLRPGFSRGMAPEPAQALYEELVTVARAKHASIASGLFAADMKITLENDGPVTFLLRAA
ncbi:MAG: D-aminoacyl-tRNA deacylase [Pseudohongiellaceae bacterium]